MIYYLVIKIIYVNNIKKNKAKKLQKQNDKSININNIDESKRISDLTYKQLSIGMSLYGSICKINELDVVVSLPNGLLGYLSLREVNDVISDLVDKFVMSETDNNDINEDDIPSLSELYHIGQYIKVVIVKLDRNKKGNRIELSSRPSLLNKGIEYDLLEINQLVTVSIKNELDHGYIISTGIYNNDEHEITGFISHEKVNNVMIGMNIDLKIIEIKSNSLLFDIITNIQSYQVTQSLTIDALTPGLLVSCKIKHIVDYGLIVKIMNIFDGFITLLHCKHSIQQQNLYDDYKINENIQCRILYIDYVQQKIVLTHVDSLIKLENYQNKHHDHITKGFISQAKIIYKNKQGLYLYDDKNQISLYAHISQLNDNDKKIDNLLTNNFYAINTIHSYRLLKINYIDHICHVTLKSKIINNPIFDIHDISIGQLLTVTIKHINEYNHTITTSINQSIDAILLKHHLNDLTLNLSLIKKNLKLIKVLKYVYYLLIMIKIKYLLLKNNH